MASHIERRKFLATLSGVAGWPLVARGQQPAMPVVGLLSSAGPDTYAHYIAAFREGLSEFGYIEGQNVLIEYRWAEGHYDRIPPIRALSPLTEASKMVRFAWAFD